MMANITGAAKGFAEKRFMEQSARLKAKIDAKRVVAQQKRFDVLVKSIVDREVLSELNDAEGFESPDIGQTGRFLMAEKVVQLLSGLTIGEMRSVFSLAETLVCQTHFVDAQAIEFLKVSEVLKRVYP